MSRRSAFVCAAVVLVAVLATATCGLGFEKRAFQMQSDLGMEPLGGCALQYYYSIPCPTWSWFWAFTIGPEDLIGAWFDVGDISTGGYGTCDPSECHSLTRLTIFDFAGYGVIYPGLWTVTFDAYCSDDEGCPLGPSLWNSGPVETEFGWNDIPVEPPLSLCDCAANPGPPPTGPRIAIITRAIADHHLWWGMDNIGTPVTMGCEMHDVGCLPALFPRPYTSHYETMHSGYYGTWEITHCPPVMITDGYDTTPDGTQYGHIELLWTIQVECTGPTSAKTTTWSSIKSMYR